jgi:hypothetical protein
MSGADILTQNGSAEAVSDGRTTRVWLSHNWAGTIKCAGPVIVTRARRDRGWLEKLFARLPRLHSHCPVNAGDGHAMDLGKSNENRAAEQTNYGPASPMCDTKSLATTSSWGRTNGAAAQSKKSADC